MAGLVRINTITPGPLPWDGIYFENVPVEIEAVAQPGYLFEQWETNQHIASGDMEQFTKLNTIPLFTDDLYQAHFIPCPDDASATVEASDTGLSVTTSNVPYADSIAWHLDGVTVGLAPAGGQNSPATTRQRCSLMAAASRQAKPTWRGLAPWPWRRWKPAGQPSTRTRPMRGRSSRSNPAA